jgi:membrane protein DedA with SNARE-associated domain
MISLPTITRLLGIYQYIILFPLATVEGPIVSVIAGFLVFTGQLHFALTIAVLIGGDLLGDLIYYSIGRYGGRSFVDRWGKYIGLHAERIGAVEAHFQNHPGKTLFFGKTQPWGSLILAAAGIAHMPFGRFMQLNLLATVPKSLFFLLLGYYFGHLYSIVALDRSIKYAGFAVFLIGIAVVLRFFRRRQALE